jgi:cell division septum initiation protein DivIVA
MLEDLDLLASRVAELARLVQSLRTENQQLRAQLATATRELDSMRARVDEASRRLDGLMDRLPASQTPPNAPWNT